MKINVRDECGTTMISYALLFFWGSPFAQKKALLYNISMDDVSRYYFEKQLVFSLVHQRYMDCPYYPCHKMTEQNCFFCYCPFYPCQDETKGVWLSTPEKRVWDCSPCQWIHTDGVVKRIIELFYEGKNISQIKEVLVKENLW